MAVRSGANGSQVEFDAETLLDMQDRLTAMQVILSGCFDKQLIEMRNLKNDLATRQGIVNTIEKAEKVHAEAFDAANSVKADADEVMRLAKAAQGKADARLQEAIDRENYLNTDIAARQAKLQSDIDAWNETEKSKRTDLANQEALLKQAYENKKNDLAKRESDLRAAQAALAMDRAELKERQEKFQAKVNAIMETK